ncbi:hypothetical protein MNBD_GAMMA12-2133, partial [hydrothermal vent metagenome]
MTENKFKLSTEEIASLRIEHRQAKKKRDADRIKAIVLLATGWTAMQVAEVLFMDDDTVRHYRARYETGGLKNLLKNNYKPKKSKLVKHEQETLLKHIDTEIYMTVRSIINYVRKKYHVIYSLSG